MSLLGDRLLAIHDALDEAGIAHAFGGAIALAYCTEEPRGTRDIDVNLFVQAGDAVRVLDAMPKGVAYSASDVNAIARDDQVRLWWDDTPLDLFFEAHAFHRAMRGAIRDVAFENRRIPVVDCRSLTVFKVMFNRTRDWADIEAMVDAGAIDAAEAADAVGALLGEDDAGVARLRGLGTTRR